MAVLGLIFAILSMVFAMVAVGLSSPETQVDDVLTVPAIFFGIIALACIPFAVENW